MSRLGLCVLFSLGLAVGCGGADTDMPANNEAGETSPLAGDPAPVEPRADEGDTAGTAGDTQPELAPALEAQIHNALNNEQTLADHRIEVNVEEGRVTLSGTVMSEEQKQKAQTIAGAVVGVTDVVNQIEVEQ